MTSHSSACAAVTLSFALFAPVLACAQAASKPAEGTPPAVTEVPPTETQPSETQPSETEIDPDAAWAESTPPAESASSPETEAALMAPSFELGSIRASEPGFPPLRGMLSTTSHAFGIGLRFRFLDLSGDLALAAALSARIAYASGSALREGQVNSRLDLWPRAELSYAFPTLGWASAEASASLGFSTDRLQYSLGHVNSWMPKLGGRAALVSGRSYFGERLRLRLAANAEGWAFLARYSTDQPEPQPPELSPDLAVASFAGRGALRGYECALEPGMQIRFPAGSEHALGLKFSWKRSRYLNLRTLDSLLEGRSQADLLLRESSFALRWERIR